MQSKLENMYNRRRRQARAPSALRVMQRPHDIEPTADQVRLLMIAAASRALIVAIPVIWVCRHKCAVFSEAKSQFAALICLALHAAASKSVAVAQTTGTGSQIVHAVVSLDPCNTGRAAIWLSAAVSTGLKPLLYPYLASPWTKYRQGVWAGDGKTGLCTYMPNE